MLRFNLFFAAIIVALFTTTSCHTAQKYVENGDYDGAIDFCVDKLSGRKKKSDDLVKGLEVAFQKATERDMRAVDALMAENQPANWERIHKIHLRIQDRQNHVYPLIPLKSEKGYDAKFLFVNIEKLELESRTNAAEYVYNKANAKMELARNGNKAAAREAYYLLEELEQEYFRDYKNKDALKREAERSGIVHVLFEIRNETGRILPIGFDDRVLAISKNDLDTKWRRYHFENETGVQYDYKAIFRLDNIDISPERIHERSYTDEKRVKDGWEYAYDNKGNVKKDSFGNDIKHDRFIVARAQVIEVHQSKAARLAGYVDIYDADSKNRLDSRPLATEILFEHYASTFNGDARALSDDSRCRIGNRPVPFPLDSDMLVQAADRLKPSLSYELGHAVALK